MEQWQPSASLSHLRLRAQVLSQIRQFFIERQVLEVETPILSQHTVTDLHIDSFKTLYHQGQQQRNYYLQTSPEYAMKRLLAAGSGPIFQISKAFRNSEEGSRHNPEFTLLEWYRPGFNHFDLMNEMDELLQTVANTLPAERLTYQEVFQHTLHLDPYNSTLAQLHLYAQQQSLNIPYLENKDALLQLLLTHCIEPQLGHERPLFLYHFPTSQAALAKINQTSVPAVAERFEVYIRGIELANGFHELTDPTEQFNRFETDQRLRHQQGKTIIDIDMRLIQALQQGLPPCAGVALGLDRWLMLIANASRVDEVLSFAWERA